MTAFTATPDPANGTMKLEIVKTDTITTLTRSDVNGTRPVRTTAGTLPSAGAGTIGITDHEPALTGDIVYTLDGAGVRTRFAPGGRPRFTLPFHPEITLAVDAVMTFTASREPAGTEHEIIGRPDPIIITAPMRSRRGSLEVVFDEYEQALELEGLLALGKTVMYRQSENFGQDLYFNPKSVSLASEDGIWKVTAGFTQLRPPAGTRAAYGWTFGALAALPGATFNSLPGDYESFDTLSIGQEL